MKKLAIIGASGHGKVVADLAEQLGYTVFFFDDARPQLNKNSRWSVVGNTAKFLQVQQEFVGAVVAIGNNVIRKNIILKLLEQKVLLQALFHLKATLSSCDRIGVVSVVLC